MASSRTTRRGSPAAQGSLRLISESSEVPLSYPMIRTEDLGDPRPRFPVQVNIKLRAETGRQLDELAARLNTPRGALARQLLIKALAQLDAAKEG